MTFLKNTWYVGAWSSEIEDAQPFSRKILGEQILFYRDEAGDVVAASNMCPHRFAPLDRGKVVQGTIECPYHGLRFNNRGDCVYNPDGDGAIPTGARLKTYPVEERWNCAWIWMGDPALADASIIPDYPFLGDPTTYRPVIGYLNVKANYRYINDNVMDQAHLHMVHHDSLACDMIRVAKTSVIREPDGGIWCNRFGENGAPPAIFDMMWRMVHGDYEGSMDHWVEARWNAPALVMNNTGVALHGRPREEGIETKNSHFFTPETETTTHYFWSICRNFDLVNPDLDAKIKAGTEYAFVHEDEVMLEAIQETMGDKEFWSLKPALLTSDAGAVQLRRVLDRLIAAEQQAETKPPIERNVAALNLVEG